ncbi:MAG: gamma-glutamylcyclotransferase family protein [Acidobacteriota bacterium]
MSRVLLVGYGTLLDQGSLGDTIGADRAGTKVARPVTVRDYRRLFNLRPDHYQASCELGKAGIEAGAMNVEPAEGHHFNALAFEVDAGELERLDHRERYYQRRVEPLYDFATGESIGEGSLYTAPRTAQWIERDPDRLLPRWLDVELGRRGAYRVGRAFGEDFDRTTFLADGITPLAAAYGDSWEERTRRLMAELAGR